MSSFICLLLCLGIVVVMTFANRAPRVDGGGNKLQIKVGNAHAFDEIRATPHSGLVATNEFKVPQSGQGEKTVDKSRKNIQILKGLPESQLFLLMNFVATSLGVECNFCHVQQGKDPNTGLTKWVWESDDKPQKQTARQMMQMVLSIKANDKIDFRENPVTCYTCHRGQRQPAGLPPMPLTRSGHEGINETTPRTQTTLPSVDQILAKYVEALGGNAASTTKTLVLKGRREASQSRNWSNEISVAIPDRFLIVATTPQSTTRQIINGDKGWIVSGTNVRNLSASEAGEAGRTLDQVFNVIKVKRAPNMHLMGMEKVGEHDAYVIENAAESKTERYYFDSQTALLLRKITLHKTILMPFPEQIDFEDYRAVDGVKIPFMIRYSAIDTFDSWTRTFTEVKRNAALSDSMFANPNPSPK